MFPVAILIVFTGWHELIAHVSSPFGYELGSQGGPGTVHSKYEYYSRFFGV